MPSIFSLSWILLRDAGGEAPPLVASAVVAKAVRDTVMSKWGRPIPEWLSGHQPDGSRSLKPHLAVVPAADVGRPRSTGRLLGMALVLPRDLAEAEQHAIERLRDATSGIVELRLGALGVWDLSVPDKTVAIDAPYSAPARTWASVTPVVLDRHPDAKNRDLEIKVMIADACGHAGLPRPHPRDIKFGPTSACPGSPPSQTGETAWGDGGWSLPRRSDGDLHPLRNNLSRHVTITFPETVVGPVLIGAGRYMGLGLCRAIEQPK